MSNFDEDIFQFPSGGRLFFRRCERSEAIHLAAQKKEEWIASSLRSSQ
jgi:hypothetical protein